jgi:SPP1 gp7 family putative phage head morphogenesis protein
MTMNNRDYWQNRYLQTKQAAERQSALYEAESIKQMDHIYSTINQQLVKWYKRYAKTSGTDFNTAAQILKSAKGETWEMKLDDFIRKAKQGGYDQELDLVYIKSQVARLQQLQIQLAKQIAPVIPQFQAGFGDELEANFDNTYLHTSYLNESVTGINANFSRYNQKQIQLAVQKPWYKNQNFSQRIWKDLHSNLPNVLTSSISESIVLGYGSKKMAKQLAERYANFKKVDWHRLVHTEMAHVTETATFQSYEDDSIKKYEYMATLESHTCDVCGHLDGREFRMSDKRDGENYPPIHPWCRCTTTAVVPGYPPVGKRWERGEDGKGRLVDNVSFDDWKRDRNKKLEQAAEKARNEVIQSVKNRIKSGEFPLELNQNLQKKHDIHSSSYVEGKSFFDDGIDVQNLVNQHAGNGIIKLNRKDKWQRNFEFHHTNKYVGWVHDANGQLVHVKSFRIAYGKKGTHVFPDLD